MKQSMRSSIPAKAEAPKYNKEEILTSYYHPVSDT
jgi:hypothetical protein